MGLKSLDKVLYVSPLPSGDVDFQVKNLGLPVREVEQDEFINLVFGDFSGNLCIFQKTSDGKNRNVFYKKKDKERIGTFLKKTFGIDTYISYSTFYRNKRNQPKDVLRTQSNIVHTYMLVQDLDYYKFGMKDAEFLQAIGELIQNGEILCPNFIVSTGQGYQLIWLVEPFKNIKGYSNDRDWSSIQEHLFVKLIQFNSDRVVKNPSAVTRMPGTRHRKSKNYVYAFLANEVTFQLKDFTFYHELIPDPDRIVKPRKTPKTSTSKKVTRLVESWNEFTLNRSREEDIFTFVHIQNERGISYIGIRNWLALVLRFHSLVSSGGDYEYAENRVVDLCSIMDMTETTEKEILRRSAPSEKHYEEWVTDTWDRDKYLRGGLFYTNARMLDLMEIKEDYYMQWKLKTIKIKHKKYEAARKRFERLASGQVKGTMEEYNKQRTEQKEDKLWLLQKAMEQYPKASNYKLAKITGLSEGYVRKLKKQI